MNSPAEIAGNYIATGTGKTKLSVMRMLVLGILAGMFIALAGAAATTAAATISSPSVAKLISACVFPAGLAMVMLAGGELFTGNCLIIIPVLSGEATVGGMLKNWLFVYLGNFIGSVLVALAFVIGGTTSMFSNGLAVSVISAACAKVSISFGDAFIRGILCNVLVCIGVWMAYASKTAGGKVVCLFFPIVAFVICGYEHCIANMYYIPAGLFAILDPEYLAAYGGDTSMLTWGALFVKNLLPVTLGNIVGGTGIVGCGYWLAYLKREKVRV